MSDNDSASAGPLSPTGDPVPYDEDLVDALQPLFVGISGLPGAMFRPRWQPDDVPNLPEAHDDWAALGVSRTRTDTFAYVAHVASGAGYDYLQRSEEIDLLLSFYGPRARANAERTRDGLSVAQNLAPLAAMNVGLVGVGDSVPLPALLHGKWQRRVDLTVTLRRCVERRYGVLTVVGLPDGGAGPRMGIDNELYLTPIVVGNP